MLWFPSVSPASVYSLFFFVLYVLAPLAFFPVSSHILYFFPVTGPFSQPGKLFPSLLSFIIQLSVPCLLKKAPLTPQI